jgi:peptide/nickel transport system substrate-binding protein/oligopeptide transport system substrate-binding protein
VSFLLLSSGGTLRSASREPVFRYPLYDDVPTLDPALIEEPLGITTAQNLYDGLTRWDINWNIVPAIASKWDISADGKVYTFHLRKDVKFSNGDPVTARDFKYSWERVTRPETKSPYTFVFEDIQGAKDVIDGKAKEIAGVKAIDDYTLEVTLAFPSAYFLAETGIWTYSVVSRKVIEQYGDQWTAPGHQVGTGAFVAKEWVHGSKLTLEANPSYYLGRPALQRVEMLVVQDPSAAILKYQNNELDTVDVSQADYQRVKQDPKLSKELTEQPRARQRWLGFNVSKEPFKGNLALRQAVAMAIDTNRLVAVALSGTGIPANTLLPPNMPEYSRDIHGYPFDAAKAKAKLAEAGYPNGKGLDLTFYFQSGTEEYGKVAENLQAQLEQNLGLKIKLQGMPVKDYLPFRGNPKTTPPMFMGTWGSDYPHGQTWYQPMFYSGEPFNWERWSNKQYDDLVDQANRTLDPKKRSALYQRAERVLLDDAPFVPLYYPKSIYLIKPWVKGWKYSPNMPGPFRLIVISG